MIGLVLVQPNVSIDHDRLTGDFLRLGIRSQEEHGVSRDISRFYRVLPATGIRLTFSISPHD